MPDEEGRQSKEFSHENAGTMHKIFRLLTRAALTGRCRSGGSADTRIRELIRVSRCPPIHVRVADSAACHSSHLISPIKSALIGVNLRFLSLLCVSASPCETSVILFRPPLEFLAPWRFNLIRVHQWHTHPWFFCIFVVKNLPELSF
jgi:hypothetical protein